MTQRTAPWENWHLERGFELLRTFGLVRKEKTQNAFIKTPNPSYPTHDDQAIDSLNPCSDKEPVLPRPNVSEIAANSRFLILSLTNNDMSKKSPFAIHKALIGIGGTTVSHPQLPTLVSDTKEQPSQAHGPRKDSKKTDLKKIKPNTNLKVTSVKDTSLKIAREQDSPKETSPVSKKSRRRKTFKSSDAKDTDTNLSDSDCVIDDVKDIIRQYHPVCVALKETFLKSCHTTKISRYGCVRKDTEVPSVSRGVCIFTSLDVSSSALPLHTSLQAVAVRIHSTSLITVCCLYLPPNAVIHQKDFNNLVDKLPSPFAILGDFNGHSTLRGSAKTNPRGRLIEQVLSYHCLCLLNHEEPTYFHEPTRSFHTLDLAICSPSLLPHLNLSIEKDLYNSENFPIIFSHDYDTGGKTFPPTYSYCRADWALFTQLAVITDAMIKTESVDTAVQEVTNVLITAAELFIPKSSSHLFQHYKPWWNTDCQTAHKNQQNL
ncbi:putative RNA-directed DNA polymerase from transposon X-element [Trichonephila clavipes]|nr:putative RNA-directed DNA polymerase from transposon X-element [Trichonephila clavipes]